MNNAIFNDDAERAVIGAIIMSGETAMENCIEYGVNLDWFYSKPNRLIFDVLLGLEKIDQMLFQMEAKRQNLIEAIGGYEYIETCCDAAPVNSLLPKYVDALRVAYKLRKVSNSAHNATLQAQDGVNPDTIIAELSNELTSLSATSSEKTTADAMDDNVTVLNNAYEGITSGLELPWPKLTMVTGGAQLASVIPLVGRDGKGKSGALAQMLDHWCGIGVPTLAFSLEDVKRRVLLRMGGNRMGYSARTIETGRKIFMGRWERICEAERSDLINRLNAYKEFLDKAPFWIHDEPHTVEQICSRIRHYKRTKGIKAVSIDGFKDIIFTQGKTTNDAQNHISQRLCSVAKECEVAIIVVSHIRKTDDNAPICKQDITGASSQFQGARQVFIFQDAGIDGVDGQSTFGLDCAKSNFTGGGMVKLRRDESILTYTEIS